jgi:predicted dehydrogenase
MNNIKFAVLGFGGAGRAHVRRLQNIKGVQVKIVYDPKISQLKKITSTLKDINFTDRLEEIFAEKLDALTVCTPDHTHFEYAKIAVEQNLHTLVEKPMFVTLKQCDIMNKILKKNSVVFGVHHQMRYVPSFRAAYELVRKGVLGKILAIEADYIHDMRTRATAFDNWRVDHENPQNVVLGGLSHTMDLMRWIADEEVEDMFSFAGHTGWKEYPDVDTVVASLRFKSGTIGKGTITISSSGPQRNTIAIYGTHGQIHNNIFRDTYGAVSFIRNPDMGFKKNILTRLLTPFMKRHSSILRDYPFSIYEHEIACKALLSDFVSAVRTGQPFPIGFNEGRSTVRLCLACIEAYKTGKSVALYPK